MPPATLAYDTESRSGVHDCAVWAHLGRDADGSEAACSAGFIEETIACVLAAPSHTAAAPLMQEACRAFATLAFASSDGKASLREAGVVRALRVAMERHPTDAKVQEMSRALLSACS